MKTIVYIHGAASTSTSFQYVRTQLPKHNAILIEYDYSVKLVDALAEISGKISAALDESDQYFDIVSHSLGGIMAANIVDSGKFNVDKLVTISTPFGGSDAASYLRVLFPFTQLFKEISPNGAFLKNTRNMLESPGLMNDINGAGNFLPIVTHSKGIIDRAENDNVVSVKSQRALYWVDYKQVEYNHFEVLLARPVVTIIKDFLWK